jgi:phosphoglycerate kinase
MGKGINSGIMTIDQYPIKGKRLLIRVDFNVPLDGEGNITDDVRIRRALPTINYALDEGAAVILVSHMGRPKGQEVPALSLAGVAKRLARLLQKEVAFAPGVVGPEIASIAAALKPGEVMMLENVRFHPGESANDPEFSQALAGLADVYVNDAFATAHRKHASTYGVAGVAKVALAGFLMKEEIEYFQRAMETPVRPLVAIVGGAKVSSKINVLEHLLEKVDKIIIGGGLAIPFLKAHGREIGKSLCEEGMEVVAERIFQKAMTAGVKVYLPVDCVVADRFDPRAETKVVPVQEVPADWMILDIGPASSTLFREVLQNAKTIIWNGPMGAFEIDAFSRGTMAMVDTVADSYALTIVGGGDTDVAVHKAGQSYKISYISTGGGAFLELLEGKDLPGIAILRKGK